MDWSIWLLWSDVGVMQRTPPRTALAVSEEWMLWRMRPLTWLGLFGCTVSLSLSLGISSFNPLWRASTSEDLTEGDGLNWATRSADDTGLEPSDSESLPVSMSFFACWAHDFLCCSRTTMAIAARLAPTMRNSVPITKSVRLPLGSAGRSWSEVTTTVLFVLGARGVREVGGAAEGDEVGIGMPMRSELVCVCAVVGVTDGDALGKSQTLSFVSSASICTNLQDRRKCDSQCITHYKQLTRRATYWIILLRNHKYVISCSRSVQKLKGEQYFFFFFLNISARTRTDQSFQSQPI